MCLRYLGFVLVWFPAVLQAQRTSQHCAAPRLKDGYFVPEEETYVHESKLTYACDSGHKPAVEGWWATSRCENGEWSHKPQCIDQDACLPPEIANAKYTESPNGWFKEGQVIRITCDEGYEHKNFDATAKCVNGTWSSVPVCEKSTDACGKPPKVPHAVIVHQGYQEVFAADSQVQYQCEDGYTVEGADNKKSIFCISGNWTELPTCKRGSRPGTGHGGSTVGGAGGRGTTSAGSGTQPAGGDRGTRPGTGHGGSSVGGTGQEHTTSTGSGTQPADRDTRPGTGHGAESSGESTHHEGGGSSTTSGSNDRDSQPLITTIDHCGKHPQVPNGDAVPEGQMSLKYQCNHFYTLIGSDTVVCYGDGRWSQLPTCKEAFCVLRKGNYLRGYVQVSADEYLKEGERKNLPCGGYTIYYSLAHCTNGRIFFTNCCHRDDHHRGLCY